MAAGMRLLPGLEDILELYDIKYFLLTLMPSKGRPIQTFSGLTAMEVETAEFQNGLSTYSPYRIKDRSLAVFGRNTMVSLQVWSKDYGYPGDSSYREFHKQQPGSGFKYWRVTDRQSDLGSKLVYDREQAQEKVRSMPAILWIRWKLWP